MIFIVNGVIRSLSNRERIHELKLLLLGKEVQITEKDSLIVKDILLSNHTVMFCDKTEHFEIKKVKKIEIDYQMQRIRIHNKNNLFIIPFS